MKSKSSMSNVSYQNVVYFPDFGSFLFLKNGFWNLASDIFRAFRLEVMIDQNRVRTDGLKHALGQ